jgi:hypothetical protein
MESKLPLSNELDADDDYPRGVNLKLTPIEKFVFWGLVLFAASVACTLFAVLYVIGRFIWALALQA